MEFAIWGADGDSKLVDDPARIIESPVQRFHLLYLKKGNSTEGQF